MFFNSLGVCTVLPIWGGRTFASWDDTNIFSGVEADKLTFAIDVVILLFMKKKKSHMGMRGEVSRVLQGSTHEYIRVATYM